jgi:hypothetical protein
MSNPVRFSLGFLAFFLLSSSGQIPQWQILSPSPTPNALTGVAVGAGRFVAVGNQVLIFSDDNGTSWEPGSGFAPIEYSALTYAYNMFVAVGTGNQLSTSTDGKLWTARSLPGQFELKTINYGNGVFVAAGNRGAILSSADGQTWIEQTSGTSADVKSAAFGNGRFLLLEEGDITNYVPAYLASTNGTQWNRFVAQYPAVPCAGNRCQLYQSTVSLAYGNGQFVAGTTLWNFILGGLSRTLVSADGVTWTVARENTPITGLSFLNGMFFAFESSANVSTDLTNWSSFYPSLPAPLPEQPSPKIAFGNNTYVLAAASDLSPFILVGSALTNLHRVDHPIRRPPLTGLASARDIIAAVSSSWD